VTAARTRFFALMSLLLTALLGGELLAVRSGGALLAVAHRVSFKLALLEGHGSAELLVLGSSRGNDCVAPGPIGNNGVSVATPSSTLQSLEYIAEQSAGTRGLKLALIELSRRQAADGFSDVESPGLDVDPRQDPVGAWLSAHSALLRGRRAFAAENWSRLPALVAPSRYDGSEFFHTKWFSESFVSPGVPAPGELKQLLPAADEPSAPSGAEWERISAGYRRAVEAYRNRGVRVLLYGPPLAAKRRADECDVESRRFRAAVAAFAGAPFDDFTCTEVPSTWLTDGDEHCGALGRARFSQRLGEVARARGLLP
jgi:hypothetical protein